ncbi:MAG TPA: hypothetical protein VNL70_02405, partial [Tepidisphaeraceae bacterium]|nr:hypothetical protein [Tepidisphaeraceae bacterium]
GDAGVFAGTLGFENATSGSITMTPATGALGTVTYTLPAASQTLGHISVPVALGAAATHVDGVFFIADRPYKVTDIDAIWAVAESTGSMDVMVERLQGTEACGSGDDLLAAAIDATGTANTVNNGTLTATTANLTLAAGDRLCLDLTATPNEITNLVVTVGLDPA